MGERHGDDLAIAINPAAFQPELLDQAGETLILLAGTSRVLISMRSSRWDEPTSSDTSAELRAGSHGHG